MKIATVSWKTDYMSRAKKARGIPADEGERISLKVREYTCFKKGVRGRYLIPKKSIISYSEEEIPDSVVFFYYHEWIKRGRPNLLLLMNELGKEFKELEKVAGGETR